MKKPCANDTPSSPSRFMTSRLSTRSAIAWILNARAMRAIDSTTHSSAPSRSTLRTNCPSIFT